MRVRHANSPDQLEPVDVRADALLPFGGSGNPPSSSMMDAIDAIRRGEIVMVVDDEERGNEGDVIMAAEAGTPDKLGVFLQHTSGVICVAMTGERLDALDLPLMVHANREAQGTAFTISVDAAQGVTTGISAADRAFTLRTIADPAAARDDLVRPGHVFP